MLRAIQELEPQVMCNWYVVAPSRRWLVLTHKLPDRFESSYGARFYTSKFHMNQDATMGQGPHYVLYRSLDGPAIRTSWYVLSTPRRNFK